MHPLLSYRRSIPASDINASPISSSCSKIWKKGSSVRFDMTLLGFENMKWERGNRSVVFTAEPTDDPSRVVITMKNIDHDARMAFVEEANVAVR